jgi:hypothetical protein
MLIKILIIYSINISFGLVEILLNDGHLYTSKEIIMDILTWFPRNILTLILFLKTK